MAIASAGTPYRREPAASPARPTSPIAAARRTLGSGRASTTNPNAHKTPSAGTPHDRRPAQRARPRTNASTMVKFAPDTAVRCERPAVRKSSTTWSGMPDTSPTTRAGTRPRSASGSPATADRSPVRSRLAPRSSQPGGSTSSGGDRAASTATSRSPGDVSASRPTVRTTAPGRTSIQATDPVRTTGAFSRVVVPRATTRTVVASTTT
jgi:hypothetical protein